MWTATNGTKCCATCSHWRGPRELRGTSVVTASPGERGKCAAGVFSSVTQGHCAYQNSDCNKYVKWL